LAANKRCAVSYPPQIFEIGLHFHHDFQESSKTEKNALSTHQERKYWKNQKKLVLVFWEMTATVRHLVFIVDTTAAMGPHLPVLRDAYIDPLIRCAINFYAAPQI
jgi:hypothetical protein